MSLQYNTLKSELSGVDRIRPDSYVNSALYYLLTGRKGLAQYRDSKSTLITCVHPHIEDRLLVFPEVGDGDFSLTQSVLDSIDPPTNGVQLARYTDGDIEELQQRLRESHRSSRVSLHVQEESVMDWKYPVRVIDTVRTSQLQGKKFKQIRTKYRKAAAKVRAVPVSSEDDIRLMRSVVKFWEGNMILARKDTPGMGDFYTALFEAAIHNLDSVEGLVFINDDRPVGFSVWEVNCAGNASYLANLSDTSMTGVSDYQMVESCKMMISRGISYANLGGSELRSLDEFKAKYLPHYSVSLKSVDVVYG